MLKLLFWAVVLYFVYQWVQRKLALTQGKNQFSQPQTRNPERDANDEGEYIDYEEIK
ncbi:MAG: hypothetical protein KatS3mg029_0982 [Saprospiraceae bacterium]|nr:MAG: hypothetical protein KatS3mg029_0982 [Saprospiraceae bacterium]